MDAKSMTLRDLFGPDRRLVVPVFQRPYVWTEDRNWRPLWEDVTALVHQRMADEEVHPHFLGAVVLDQLLTLTGSMPARQVIDGQQRLTTLQVLLAAVRDVAQELDVQDKYVRALVKLIANDDDMTDDPHAAYKVWPTNIDRDSFCMVMDGRLRRPVDVAFPVTPGASAIVQAYWFFRNRTVEWAQELNYESRLDKGFDALVRVLRDKFELVIIDLKPEDNAQVIFEALNDRGTPLQASDLVKNLVFQQAEEQGLPVEELYRDLWAQLETPDWRKEVRQGRLKRPRLDVFLMQYLTGELAEEVMAPELFLTFRRYVKAADMGLVALMRRLAERAGAYRRLTAEEQPPTPEGRFLRTVGVLDANTVMPVLLWLVSRFDEDDRAGAVATLDSYLVRRTVCRLTTKNYNRLFLELLKELKAKDDPSVVADFLLRQETDSGFWPHDRDIRDVFRSQPLYKQLTRTRMRLLLAELEDSLYSGKTERQVHNGELTIEHLLPQAWEEHWPLPEGGGGGSVEAHERRQSLLHTVGNLTLLTGRLNTSVSNGPWERKRNDILVHSALSLNRSLPAQWDEESILARADHLSEALCRRWQRPDGGAPTSSVAGFPAPRLGAREATPVGRPATVQMPRSRRDVARHMREAFSGLPVGSVLTVSQITAVPTSQYEGGEISPGAVAARLRADNVPGIRAVPGSSPLSARKIS
ncbi:DUF262 domain-containing protein [Streptomyces europaeiscabiei]|uniref:DUF262 domain-containing protein n=1 Tax=Streptomyces europaeiscabiei TaxID=146819 RepID=UPI0029A01BD1|nr:DUF262 domain-containing HNH endonuclease family protein [Streptomyces europaeiscabiei]MDX3613521.1 DUF262 domain-containing HNH endonuclease family protein [Streptomyces europaeiscabiei]